MREVPDRGVNASILGMPPLHGECYLGQDGQIWKWEGERGQVTVASGGVEALAYAEQHRFPPEALHLLRAKAHEQSRGERTR